MLLLKATQLKAETSSTSKIQSAKIEGQAVRVAAVVKFITLDCLGHFCGTSACQYRSCTEICNLKA